jgi:hypothetical protein
MNEYHREGMLGFELLRGYTMGKNTAVFGIYPNYTRLEREMDALKQAGFRNADISVLFPENEAKRYEGRVKRAGFSALSSRTAPTGQNVLRDSGTNGAPNTSRPPAKLAPQKRRAKRSGKGGQLGGGANPSRPQKKGRKSRAEIVSEGETNAGNYFDRHPGFSAARRTTHLASQ